MQSDDNAGRAAHAQFALAEYVLWTGCGDEDIETQVSDLLADLRHLCDVREVDFDACLDRASFHYTEEVKDAEEN